MVTNRTIIVVVPFTILVNRHQANASRGGLRYATYGMDTITFDDFPSILFMLVECATTPKVCGVGTYIEPFAKTSLCCCGWNTFAFVTFQTSHEVPIAIMGRGMPTSHINNLFIPILRDRPWDCDVHNIQCHSDADSAFID